MSQRKTVRLLHIVGVLLLKLTFTFKNVFTYLIQKLKSMNLLDLQVFFLFVSFFFTCNRINTFSYILTGNIGPFLHFTPPCTLPRLAPPPSHWSLSKKKKVFISVLQRRKKYVQQHTKTNDKQRDKPVFVLGRRVKQATWRAGRW